MPAAAQLQPTLRRLHPLTPLVKGWRIFAGLIASGTSQGLNSVLTRDGKAFTASGVALVGGAFIASAFGALFLGWLSWRATHYGLDDGDLRIESGIIRRRSRRIRLDRLQAVDVVRPLVARVLGLAELRLEVAGGTSTEAPLAYLSERAAQALRAEILALAAGLQADTPEAPERPLHTVGNSRLLASSLLQLPVVISAVLALAVGTWALARGDGAAIFFLLPALASTLPSFGRQFVANYGFGLAESPDGLRIRRGLLETRSQTVPPGRVQAVRMTEPLLWRMFTGWARLEVEVAGYSTSGSKGAEAAVLLPVAPRRECLALLASVLPGAQVEQIATTGAPRRARWLAPMSFRILAAGGDEVYFVTRRGALQRETNVMPHERVQSVRVHQHPLQRLLGLASLTLDTTPGPVTVLAAHRDAADAWQLALQQVARARAARSAAAPERWMGARYDPGGGAAAGGAAGIGGRADGGTGAG